MSTLRNFLKTGYREVTPKKTADKAIKTIELHFANLLDKPMHKILPVEIKKWQNQYPGKASGANRILNDLQGALTKAVLFQLLDASPVKQVKKLKEDKSQEIKYLTKEEEHLLLAAVDSRQEEHRAKRLRYITHCKQRKNLDVLEPHGTFTDYLKPIVITVLNTGLRPGELFNLRVSAINKEARLLTVVGDGSKTGQTRQIFLNDLVFNTLTTWIQETGHTGLVFPSSKTGGRLDNISTAWNSLRTHSGLPEIILYNLRHTFATRLVHNRVDLGGCRT
ncbi:tyrosine-type recombinase/integrase [Endozoicomonas ascidiicola]|uniref:tyrosine-type recombinase/integrase n=1 Tax=Endozoicomonas ascidiicola TaxID=1698521 RepID=UPI0012FE44DB|nr:site-specific integrase [Endozoicomonas ascidiicola]